MFDCVLSPIVPTAHVAVLQMLDSLSAFNYNSMVGTVVSYCRQCGPARTVALSAFGG